MTLTQRDFDEIESLIDGKFDEKLKNLPTKDEFFEEMDKLMGEVKASREEQTLINRRSSDHGDRLQQLEKIHPQGQHTNPLA